MGLSFRTRANFTVVWPARPFYLNAQVVEEKVLLSPSIRWDGLASQTAFTAVLFLRGQEKGRVNIAVPFLHGGQSCEEVNYHMIKWLCCLPLLHPFSKHGQTRVCVHLNGYWFLLHRALSISLTVVTATFVWFSVNRQLCLLSYV